MDSTTLRSPIENLNPKKPICVKSGANIRQVIDTMKGHKIGCVCVTESDNLVGILTERDILSKVVGGDLDIDSTSVDDVMTKNPEYLFLDDQIAFALNRMHVGGFRHIPLINLKGTPVGVISVRDIAAYLTKNIKTTA